MTPMHLTPDHTERDFRAMVDALRRGERDVMEITTTLRRRDGGELPVEILLQYAPALGDDAEVCTAVMRDVTERVRAQEQLLDAERQLALLDDRERIGRDLHDRVIQRLFSAGLGLQATAAAVPDERVRGRIERAIDEVDESIRDLRTVIFGLAQRRGGPSLKDSVLGLAVESTRALSFEPRVHFSGPIDSTVPPALAEHVISALREILANVAKHANASAVEVHLTVTDSVLLRVEDDGRGIPDQLPQQGEGLRNLAARAGSLDGRFQARRGGAGGTTIEWEVPLPSSVPGPDAPVASQ
jgi:signal transduction histidine kinase